MTTPDSRTVGESTDFDADLHVPDQRQQSWRAQGPIVAVVALGGGIGAAARYGAGQLWPTTTAGFPWTTLWVNVIGCAVIGVFMVVITEVLAAHRLIRPFFGTGVLGGFTTFSTYAVDVERLVNAGEARAGLVYLAATLVAALSAVWLAVAAARRVLEWRRG